MSDGRHPTEGCLDAETLAAFMDGRLEPRERAAVEAHLADCEDCYEVWMDSVSAMQEVVVEPSSPRPMPSRNWYSLTALAAGAVLAFWIGTQWVPERESPVATMVNLNSGARMTDGWLTDQKAWAPRPSSRRSDVNPAPSERQLAALALVQTYEKDVTAEGTRALGLAYVALGDLASAEAALRRSAALRPEWAQAHADLAAVLLEWCREQDCRPKATDALRHAEESLRLRPQLDSAAFNRAVALEQLGQTEDAVRAWQEFAARRVASPWKEEATARLQALGRR